jgi:hypothetical protein
LILLVRARSISQHGIDGKNEAETRKSLQIQRQMLVPVERIELPTFGLQMAAERSTECTDHVLSDSIQLLAGELVDAAEHQRPQNTRVRQIAEQVRAQIVNCQQVMNSEQVSPTTQLKARESTGRSLPKTREGLEPQSQSSISAEQKEAERREKSVAQSHLTPELTEIQSRARASRRRALLDTVLRRIGKLERSLSSDSRLNMREANDIASDLRENAKQLRSLE